MYRVLHRAQKIREKLGGSANMMGSFPEKPKGMRHDTYMSCSASTTKRAGAIYPALFVYSGLDLGIWVTAPRGPRVSK